MCRSQLPVPASLPTRPPLQLPTSRVKSPGTLSCPSDHVGHPRNVTRETLRKTGLMTQPNKTNCSLGRAPPRLPHSSTSAVKKTPADRFPLLGRLAMWEWGKLKASDAFQKAHLMPPSGFRWCTFLPLSDLSSTPGHGKHSLTSAFERQTWLFLARNYSLNLKIERQDTRKSANLSIISEYKKKYDSTSPV